VISKKLGFVYANENRRGEERLDEIGRGEVG